jgi:GNAT superfamily N-acetyltransferase
VAHDDYTIVSARPEDVAALYSLIRGLADYERLAHLVVCTEADLSAALFSRKPAAEAVLVWVAGEPEPVGFALFFHNFSTFLGRAGLYLEDIFVTPRYRGRGYGRALVIHLARIAVERRCGRFEWAVLDWNTSAQAFYEKLGAVVMPDWRITRVTGEALVSLSRMD